MKHHCKEKSESNEEENIQVPIEKDVEKKKVEKEKVFAFSKSMVDKVLT